MITAYSLEENLIDLSRQYPNAIFHKENTDGSHEIAKNGINANFDNTIFKSIDDNEKESVFNTLINGSNDELESIVRNAVWNK